MRRKRMTWQVAVAVLLVAAVVSLCSPEPDAPAPTPPAMPAASVGATSASAGYEAGALIEATVSRNVDGDTIHVLTAAGVTEKVRFIGVDTPESTIRHEPYGKESSDYTKRRLPVGTRVWLETDVGLRDRYGRLLAYVWLEPPTGANAAEVREKLFNAQLLIEGYAQLLTIPPDVKYVDAFKPLQTEARDASRGLWGPPAE